MKEGLIGVIVPVYKVEKYIAECIESILAQTYTNFRLILVDDGSPDNAGKICDEYAKKDPRITVIHQENAGVTRARARGVEEADDCEFITFVDGDDKLSTIALCKLLEKMNDNIDIVMDITYYTETDNNLYINDYNNVEDFIGYKEFIKKLVFCNGGMPWGKLFRKKLFDTYTFDIPRDIIYGEDALMNIRLAFNSMRNISTIRLPLYFYRQNNNNSVCKKFVWTAKYAVLFFNYIKSSIPKDVFNEFLKEYIGIKLFFWRINGGNNLKAIGWANTQFHEQLKKDILDNNYKISYFEKQLLFHTNTLIRFFIILFRKFHSAYLIILKHLSKQK